MILASISWAASLSGTVHDAQGEPIAGVEVGVYDLTWAQATATSRNDGSWDIVGLPAGRYRLWADPPGEVDAVPGWYGGGVDACGSTPIDLAEGEDRAGLELQLAAGLAIQGLLVGPDATPAAGAVVYAIVDAPTWSYGRSTTTDATGAFVIAGIEADSVVTVSAYPAERWPDQYLGGTYDGDTAARHAVAADLDLGVVQLLGGITVEGVVAGPDGPIPDAVVYVYSGGQAVGVLADADGHYVADALPPGDVLSWAQAEGYATTYWPDEPSPVDTVTAEGEGAVVVEDLLLPLESTLAVQLADDDALDGLGVMLYNSTFTVGRGRSVDETGVVLFDGLWPGEYTMAAGGAEYGFVDGYVLEDGETKVFDVAGATVASGELEVAAWISARLLVEGEAPAYGGVMVVDAGDQGEYGGADLEGVVELSGMPALTAPVQFVSSWSCVDDPGFAESWWDDARREEDATPVTLVPGEGVDLGEVVLARDDDHDGMGDSWETEHGLDPSRDDGAEDPDGDGITNLDEWRMDTDPDGYAGAEGCGCAATPGPGWLSLLLVAAARRGRAHPCPGTRPGRR